MINLSYSIASYTVKTVVFSGHFFVPIRTLFTKKCPREPYRFYSVDNRGHVQTRVHNMYYELLVQSMLIIYGYTEWTSSYYKLSIVPKNTVNSFHVSVKPHQTRLTDMTRETIVLLLDYQSTDAD